MATTRLSGTSKLRESYRIVKQRIGEAAAKVGRKPADVLLVAVTKNASPDEIRTVVELGQRDLGENRVQALQHRVASLDEFLSRRRTLAGAAQSAEALPDVRWHMIGHLQRNKAKQVIGQVKLIHSVDSLRLAEELHTVAMRMDRVVDILIQVNASGETSKFGVTLPAVQHLAEQIDTMLHLRLRGLMTMAPHSERAEDSREPFARCAELFQDLRSAKVGGRELTVLSMGMSSDFEVAIEEGANLVRIGRALFGEGPPEPPDAPETPESIETDAEAPADDPDDN